jgi:hypothetical protein
LCGHPFLDRSSPVIALVRLHWSPSARELEDHHSQMPKGWLISTVAALQRETIQSEAADVPVWNRPDAPS